MTNARDSLEDAVEVQQELERLQVRSDLLGVLVGVGRSLEVTLGECEMHGPVATRQYASSAEEIERVL